MTSLIRCVKSNNRLRKPIHVVAMTGDRTDCGLLFNKRDVILPLYDDTGKLVIATCKRCIWLNQVRRAKHGSIIQFEAYREGLTVDAFVRRFATTHETQQSINTGNRNTSRRSDRRRSS